MQKEIETIGQYRIQRLLARGGMATVYLAQHMRTGKQVAMKLVHSGATEYSARFCSEIDLLVKLSHKHILPVIEHGEYDLWHYLVTPYISGGTLNQRLKKGPLSCEHAGKLLDQLAQALQFAHQQGLVHRDIKASNVLMRNEHFVYLADFGLAKSIDETGDFALSGYILATPEYMAPELAVDNATPRSDLYSLGILLYQMITGKLPFIGNNAINICLGHIREFPPLPSSFNANIPETVESVILRALEKDPLKRFQTVRELSQAYWKALQKDRYHQMTAITQIMPVLTAPEVHTYKIRPSHANPRQALQENRHRQMTSASQIYIPAQETPRVSMHKMRSTYRRSKLARRMLGLVVVASIPVLFGLSALSHRPSPLPARARLGSLPPHINIVIPTSTPLSTPTPTRTLTPTVPAVTTEAPQIPANPQNNTPQSGSSSGSEPPNNNTASADVNDQLNETRQILQNIPQWQRQAQSTNNNGNVSDQLDKTRRILQRISR